jgi:hypothetical protein
MYVSFANAEEIVKKLTVELKGSWQRFHATSGNFVVRDCSFAKKAIHEITRSQSKAATASHAALSPNALADAAGSPTSSRRWVRALPTAQG